MRLYSAGHVILNKSSFICHALHNVKLLPGSLWVVVGNFKPIFNHFIGHHREALAGKTTAPQNKKLHKRKPFPPIKWTTHLTIPCYINFLSFRTSHKICSGSYQPFQCEDHILSSRLSPKRGKYVRNRVFSFFPPVDSRTFRSVEDSGKGCASVNRLWLVRTDLVANYVLSSMPVQTFVARIPRLRVPFYFKHRNERDPND